MPEPRKYRVVFAPAVADELREIHDYIAADSPENAARVAERLLKAIESPSLFPQRYRQTHGRRQPSRSARLMPVPPYVIYYRILEADQVVRVLTVRHGARRRPRRFD